MEKTQEELRLQYIVQETGVDEKTALAALINARGQVFQAIDMLSNHSFRAICGKQARENL